MKKFYVVLSVVLAFLLGATACCLFKCCKGIAIVDVNEIVSRSEQIKDLRDEQIAKEQELRAWLQEAQAAIDKEPAKEKKEALAQQFNAIVNQKRQEMAAQYAEELKKVDDNITSTIAEYAKKHGYKMVFAKNQTIYGGDNITDEIAKIIK